MKNDVLRIRATEAGDYPAWRVLWGDYCAFYQTTVPEAVTETTWARILDPESSVNGIVAIDAETGTLLGFANYVLHLHTWSPKTLCYLEDLYVRPDARGRNIGHTLIESLIKKGQEQGWNRVYWHTDMENAVARRLYDRFTPADPAVRYTISLPAVSDNRSIRYDNRHPLGSAGAARYTCRYAPLRRYASLTFPAL